MGEADNKTNNLGSDKCYKRNTNGLWKRDYEVGNVQSSRDHLSEMVTIQLRSEETEGVIQKKNPVGR